MGLKWSAPHHSATLMKVPRREYALFKALIVNAVLPCGP
ncbi:hypothetical protein ETAE_1371 [Edwardsiella piscicida]|uniref:Uncharacterized protein n=1 Tax=Edwardsiella piscicida TaxID=1263550 RepID=A0AAU8P2X1_EDWPI|nr:hypothetical protein ETAE_1371 [Edwardsiella tarda EIB202]